MLTLLCGLKDEAAIFNGAPSLKVLCGATHRDLLPKLVARPCTGLISAGCAGALAPELAIGALTVASQVTDADGKVFLPALAWAQIVRAKAGAQPRTLYSSPTEQAATAAARAALRARFNVDVVDEESFAVAQLAATLNVPFLVLRAISDTADQTILPHDGQAQRPDGSEDPGPIIGDALADPAEAIREAEGFGKSLDALRAAFRILGPAFGFPS